MPRKYKNRLIVGDGNFSYTKSFIKKQIAKGKQDLAKYVTTSEIISDSELDNISKENVSKIKKFGAYVLFNFDATNPVSYQYLLETQYQRIQFNCPCPSLIGISSTREQQQQISSVMGKFFQSASIKQQPGDKIHVAIPSSIDKDRDSYYQVRYGLYDASKAAGYELIKKRKFCSNVEIEKRYHEYEHKKTTDSTSVLTAQNSREYVFKKLMPEEHVSSPRQYTVDRKKYNCFKEYNTSDDSSNYSSEDIDELDATTEGMRYLFS